MKTSGARSAKKEKRKMETTNGCDKESNKEGRNRKRDEGKSGKKREQVEIQIGATWPNMFSLLKNQRMRLG